MSERGRTAAVVAAVAVIFVAAGLLARGTASFDAVRDHSSLRTNPWGTKAWRELIERAGVRTETWDLPLTEIGPGVDTLVLLTPTEPLSATEVNAVLGWLRDGGRLIFAPRGPRAGERRTDIFQARRLVFALGLGLPAEEAPENQRAQPVADSPWLRDVASVHVPSGARLRPAPTTTDTAAEPAHLLRDAAGRSVAAECRLGDGRAVVLADAEIVSNATLREADNVVFAANLVFAGSAARTVHFDEYHHGFAHDRGVFEGPEVDVRPFWNTVLALLVVASVWALSRARRFGAPLPSASRRRPASEYVRAFARLYARAGAAGAAIEMLEAGLRGRVARATGLRANAPADQLVAAASRAGIDGEELGRLLEELQEAAEEPDDRTLLRLARKIADYERML